MNTKVLKGVAFFLVLVDVVVIFYAKAAQSTSQLAPFQLLGGIIGFGIVLFILQRLFRWILQKTRLNQESEWTALIVASLVYLAVFSFFTFAAV